MYSLCDVCVHACVTHSWSPWRCALVSMEMCIGLHGDVHWSLWGCTLVSMGMGTGLCVVFLKIVLSVEKMVEEVDEDTLG